MSNGKRAVSVVDVVITAFTVAALCTVLSPVIATSRGASALATCQGNLKRIGGAMRMYLSDWDRTYPTNRLNSNVTGQYPNWEVPLGRQGLDAATGKPGKSTSGVCWVEGLYPYIGSIAPPNGSPNVWKCPAAVNWAVGSAAGKPTAAVTYVMNFNLLEQPEGTSRQDSTLMLIREIDALVASSSRGGKGTANTIPAGPNNAPTSPFLNVSDQYTMGSIRSPKMHGSGSNILFADGHVKLFDVADLPVTAIWDAPSGRWMNTTRTISVTRSLPSTK